MYNCTQIETRPSPPTPPASLLRRRKRQLVSRLKIPPDALPGSLALTHRRCGKPSCHCADALGHPLWSLTFMVQGKKRVEHIPQQWADAVRQRVDRGREFKEAWAEVLNRQVLEHFGKTPDKMKNWATSDAVLPDDRPRVIAAFASSIETRLPYDIEHRCRRADGIYRRFQVRALPVRDTQGRISSWYILLTDIDKRKQAEDRLQLLLDVTNQVVSNLQLRDLLRAISGNIRRVMQCDCASLALPEADSTQLQLNVLDFSDGRGFFHEEGLIQSRERPTAPHFEQGSLRRSKNHSQHG
jgi:PAS domain S-box-containing protein